ncbi:hypothetical protein ABGB19_01375 [Mycobacterium sp. B14F4]|uniref:Rv2629 family ribosome hibernation factor n=1 Tax=Mycobacterium sp. B14F4 TaxID=3153565 RepID=UPI00325D048B
MNERGTLRPIDYQALLAASGPFASVYLDDSRDTGDAESMLHQRWLDLRERLEHAGADEVLQRQVQRAVLQSVPAVGRQGRVVIATPDEIVINEHLECPPAESIARVSEYPFLVPAVELSRRPPPYLFAAVDHQGADITLHGDGITRTETVDGEGHRVHKPVTAGWNGYGDLQHTVEEAVRKNVRAVAERITELVDSGAPEIVFVCGEVRSRTDVVSALPDRVAKRVSQLHAGAQGHRVREPEVARMMSAEFERHRTARVAESTDRFTSEMRRGSGLAVEGLARVCDALRAGNVATLLIGDLRDATVVTGRDLATIAQDADALSELGSAPYRVVRADEALPFAALAVAASLLRADVSAADGIGALLRFPVTEEG